LWISLSFLVVGCCTRGGAARLRRAEPYKNSVAAFATAEVAPRAHSRLSARDAFSRFASCPP
jgi:hypothetical protein